MASEAPWLGARGEVPKCEPLEADLGKRVRLGLREMGGGEWNIPGAISSSPGIRFCLKEIPCCLQINRLRMTRFTSFARHGTVGLL